MHTLDAFLKAEKQVLWWALYGAAGSGKSRLALELCFNLPSWHAGFIRLDRLTLTDWREWRPEQNTLFIIDYAEKYFDSNLKKDSPQTDLSEILIILSEKAAQYKYQVRCLLLERGILRPNEKTLSGEAKLPHQKLLTDNSGDSWAINAIYYQNEPIFLPPLNDASLIALGRDVLAEKWPQELSEAQFIEQLKALDSKARPLFAIILALALAEKNNLSKLSKEEILQMTINRENNKYWQNKGLDFHDLCLMMLATITGGLAETPLNCGTDLNLPNLWCEKGTADTRRSRFVKLNLAQKVKEDGQEKFILNPLEPDLLGEFFVLKWMMNLPSDLKPSNELHQPQKAALLKLAWHHQPNETATFFLRGVNDFPDEDLLKLFLCSTNFNGQDDKQLFKEDEPRLFWLETAIILIFHFAKPDTFKEAHKIFDAISSLGHDKEINIARARAAVNLINAYGDLGQIKEARKLFEFMEHLGEDKEINIARANAAVNLIADYGALGQIKEARELFEVMALLGEDKEIKIARAKAAFNLITDYGALGQIKEARKLFKFMTHLGEDKEINIACAKAAFNLITDYGALGQIKEAREFFEFMAHLGEDKEINIERAKAAFNLINTYIKFDQIKEARELFEVMAHLGEDKEINILRAKAAIILIISYLDLDQMEEARELFKATAHLSDDQKVAAMRAKLAKILFKA